MSELHHPDLKGGVIGWLGLVGYVVAWDVHAKRTGGETLSHAYAQGLHNHRHLVEAVGVLTLAHLHEKLPEPIDPFKLFLNRIQSRE